LQAVFEPCPDESDDGDTKMLGNVVVRIPVETSGAEGSGWIRLGTTDESCAPVVPIKWLRENRVLSAEPTFVFLGGIAPGSTQRRTVTVRSRDGSEFSLQNVRVSSTFVHASIPTNGSAAVHKVELEVTAPENPGVFQQTIVIEPDLANGSPLLVKVAGVVRKW
jgi:hypothetical protein